MRKVKNTDTRNGALGELYLSALRTKHIFAANRAHLSPDSDTFKSAQKFGSHFKRSYRRSQFGYFIPHSAQNFQHSAVCSELRSGTASCGYNYAFCGDFFAVFAVYTVTVGRMPDICNKCSTEHLYSKLLCTQSQRCQNGRGGIAVRIDPTRGVRSGQKSEVFEISRGCRSMLNNFRCSHKTSVIITRRNIFIAQIAAAVACCEYLLSYTVEPFDHEDFCLRKKPPDLDRRGKPRSSAAYYRYFCIHHITFILAQRPLLRPRDGY